MGGEDSQGLIFGLILVGLVGVVTGAMVVTIYYFAVGWFNRSRRRATSPLNRRKFPQTNQIFDQYSKELSNQEDGPSSTSNSMVQSNPIFRYSKQCEVEACSVCLCEFKEGEEVRLLPECLHLFHVACVDAWLNSFSTCPICRADTVIPLDAVLSLPTPGGTSPVGSRTPQVAGFGIVIYNDE